MPVLALLGVHGGPASVRDVALLEVLVETETAGLGRDRACLAGAHDAHVGESEHGHVAELDDVGWPEAQSFDHRGRVASVICSFCFGCLPKRRPRQRFSWEYVLLPVSGEVRLASQCLAMTD